MGSSISRRVFLKGCAGMGIMCLTGPVAASAGCLPAGISGCRDENLRFAWYYLRQGDLAKAEELFESAMAEKVGNSPEAGVNVEPAYALALAKYDALGGDGAPGIRRHMHHDLKGDNPALHAFNRGFQRFFDLHISEAAAPHDPGRKKGETPPELLALALFTAVDQDLPAGRMKTRNFLNGNFSDKKKLLKDLLPAYRSLVTAPGMDRESRDPANPYNRLLVGTHAAKWLGDHYAYSGNFRKGEPRAMSDFIYEEMEKTIEFLAAGLKVRNRCKYFNNRV